MTIFFVFVRTTSMESPKMEISLVFSPVLLVSFSSIDHATTLSIPTSSNILDLQLIYSFTFYTEPCKLISNIQSSRISFPRKSRKHFDILYTKWYSLSFISNHVASLNSLSWKLSLPYSCLESLEIRKRKTKTEKERRKFFWDQLPFYFSLPL